MGLKKLGSHIGKMAAGLGMLASVEANAETNPALQQVNLTYQGVEDCGVYLREIVTASREAGNPITRAEGAQMAAECQAAQIQAEIASLDERLEEANARLAAQGLKVENRQLFNLEGDLLGNLSTENGQIRLDLTPWDQRNEELSLQAQQALADFEQFLMDSLSS